MKTTTQTKSLSLLNTQTAKISSTICSNSSIKWNYRILWAHKRSCSIDWLSHKDNSSNCAIKWIAIRRNIKMIYCRLRANWPITKQSVRKTLFTQKNIVSFRINIEYLGTNLKQKIKNYTREFKSYKEEIQTYKLRIAFLLYKMIAKQRKWESISKIWEIRCL